MDCPHNLHRKGACTCRQQIRNAAEQLDSDQHRQLAAKAAKDRGQPEVAAAILEANSKK